MSEEFARSTGLIRPHERLHPNVHGLAILPDDDLTRFPLVRIEATVRADPAQFEGALTELAAGQRVQLSVAAEGVRLLNLALLNPNRWRKLCPPYPPWRRWVRITNGPTRKPLCWLNPRHKSKLARQGKTMSEWKLLTRFAEGCTVLVYVKA